MSWYDALEAGELTLRSSVDAAKRFGVSIDRMSVSAAAGTPLAEVRAAVERSTADVIVLRYPARETTWFAALASGPRQALLADTVVCWALPVGKGRRPAPLAGSTTQSESEGDDDLVADVVADVFGDSGNHYCSNPVFDR